MCSVTAGISFSEDFRALDGEAPALLALEIDLDQAARLRLREGREQPELTVRELLVPFRRGQIERVRRQRIVRRRTERLVLQAFLPRLIVIRNRLKPPVLGVAIEVIAAQNRVWQVVEQRVHMLVEQRQPVLHAAITGACGHRLVKRVFALAGAEHLDIALAEALEGFLAGRHFADRQKREMLARGLRALRNRIERADAFQRVAEKVEAHRARLAGRVKVDNAAAHSVFAGLHHGAGAVEARRFEPGGYLLPFRTGRRRRTALRPS